MAYFPMFINLENVPVLIVGGGITALRKAEKLSYFNPCLHVIALSYQPAMLSFLKQHHYSYEERAFEKEDLEGMQMVIAATNDASVNASIAFLAKSKHIPINSVDDLDHCSFLFPSLYTNEDIVCGISSGGHSPVISQEIRKILEAQVPDDFGIINVRLGKLRETVKKKGTMASRKAFYHQVIDLLLEEPEMSEEALADYCERYFQDED